MHVIELKSAANGSHRNHGYDGIVPDGWALIKEDVKTLKNFPFGEVKAELLPFGEPDPETGEIPQMMTMTEWIPGEVPDSGTMTPAEQREEAYNTQPIIEWEGQMLTVTQAAQKWQYYAAEGNPKADELQTLIAAAKQSIREQFPDGEAAE